VAAGLDMGDWRGSLKRGDELAYLFAVPSRQLGRCLPLPVAPGAWIPLIQTRSQLISKAGVGRVYLDWDGIPSLRHFQ
jgi:hypothetical protein